MIHKVLIIGLGIGKLYQKVLSDTTKYTVVTIDIDPYKEPDFLDIDTCKQVNPVFDLALVCVPNYLHEEMVMKLITNDMAKNILVEKPGLCDFATWISAVHIGEPNKLIMIKNNMYRDSYPAIIKTITENRFDIKSVNILWLNKDRVPHPGSWFTNKKLAYGGVSRDLMPHLLSIYYSLFEELNIPSEVYKKQRYTLADLTSSTYGKVNKDGVYDVDDYCRIKFRNTVEGSIVPVTLEASWKTDIEKSKIGIEIELRNGKQIFYEFGLCQEYAYQKMIEHTFKMSKKDYRKNIDIDIWIHNIIDNVD